MTEKTDKEKIIKKYEPYSYHTFIYPFSYSLQSAEENNNNEAIRNILKVSGWEIEKFYDEKKEQYEGQFEEQYNVYQYLLPNARQNVLNVPHIIGSHDICQHFIYSMEPKGDSSKSVYNIILRDSKEKNVPEINRTITLKIEMIKLSIFYKLGIGILSIETSYEGGQSVIFNSREITESIDVVKIINDYGRRLFSPVYNLNNSFTAEKIQINLLTKCKDRENIIKETLEVNLAKDKMDISKQYGASGIIGKLVNAENKLMRINPILDDRMFVAFVIRDDDLAQRCKNNLDDMDQELYEIAFCDGDGPTCTNNEMLKGKIKDHIYKRWSGYGTIHTATEYALGCITDKSSDASLAVTPFLTEYIAMAKLTLAQRAALVNLENRAGDVSTKAADVSNEKESIIGEIRELWIKYVIFQNELYMPEATFQEQGVEIYHMLKTTLKLEQQNEYLEDELNNLQNIAELMNSQTEKESNKRLNDSINLLTIVATGLAIVSAGQDFLAGTDAKRDHEMIILGAIYIAGFAILTVGLLFSYRLLSKKLDMKPKSNKTSETDRKNKDVGIISYFIFGIIIFLIVFVMFVVKKIMFV